MSYMKYYMLESQISFQFRTVQFLNGKRLKSLQQLRYNNQPTMQISKRYILPASPVWSSLLLLFLWEVVSSFWKKTPMLRSWIFSKNASELYYQTIKKINQSKT